MKIPVLCLVACLVVAPGCKRHTSVYARPGDDPHDTDSLYALYHQILTDSDPVTVWSETVCEMYNLMNTLGPEVASRRIEAAVDTIYTRAERRRRDAIDPKLWYHGFPLDSSSCAKAWAHQYALDSALAAARKPPQTIR